MPSLPPFVADFQLYNMMNQTNKPAENTHFDLAQEFPESSFLQLPIQRVHVAVKRFQKARRKISVMQGARSSGLQSIRFDTLEQYLGLAGKFFGMDPEKWELANGDQTENFEEDGYRVKRVTGTYSSCALTLFHVNQFYDPRLAVTEEMKEALEAAGADLPVDYGKQTQLVKTDRLWQDLVKDQPWSAAKRRKVTSDWLVTKMQHGMGDAFPEGPTAASFALQLEGVHGMWEMVANKEHHQDMDIELLKPLIMFFGENFAVQLTTIALSAIWTVSINQKLRRALASNECIEGVAENLEKSLKAEVVSEAAPAEGAAEAAGEAAPAPAPAPAAGKKALTSRDREELQFKCLGTLGVSVTDRVCRRHLIEAHPTLTVLVQCTAQLEGYTERWEEKRRVLATQCLTNVFIRDAGIRKSILPLKINRGKDAALKPILALLQAEGPGHVEINRCGASILQSFALDEDAMKEMTAQGLLDDFLEACVEAVVKFVTRLEEQNEWGSLSELKAIVSTCESTTFALWGASYWVAKQPGMVDLAPVDDDLGILAQLGARIKALDDKMFYYGATQNAWSLDTMHISFGVTSSLACFCMGEETADMICNGKALDADAGPIKALQALIDPEPLSYDPDGRIRAAALTALAFLTAHPMENRTQAENAFYGHYRTKLIAHHFYGNILRSMKSPAENNESRTVIMECGSVAMMFLSTSVATADVEPWMLYILLEFLQHDASIRSSEHFVVSFWLLLRSPELRNKLRALEDPAVKKATPPPPKPPTPVKEEAEEGGEKKKRKKGEEAPLEDLQASAPIAVVSTEDKPIYEFSLDTLVGAGERWYPQVATAKTLANLKPNVQGLDAAAVKMFEFMTCSLWLYMMAPHGPIPPRRRNVSELDHPKGVDAETWWGVTMPQPEFSIDNKPSVRRSLNFLVKVLELPNRVHEKVMQIAINCIWSYSALNRAVEVHLVKHGVCSRLLAIVEESDHPWGPGLIESAASYLAYLLDEARNHGPELTPEMNQRFIVALLRHVESPYPRSAVIALRVLGHFTFTAPLSHHEPKKYVALQKDLMVQHKMCGILSRFLSRKFRLYLDSVEDPIAVEATEETEAELDTPPLEEIGVLACIAHGLRVMRNVSVRAQHQVHMAKIAVMTILKISSHFTGSLSDDNTPLEVDVVNNANGTLQNLANHPNNRTRFYKIELRGTTLAQTATDEAGPAPANLDTLAYHEPSTSKEPPRPELKLPSIGRGEMLQTVPGPPTERSSRAGSMLGQSLELSGQVRPKVKFPPINARATSSADSVIDVLDKTKNLSQEKQEFLAWMQSTFKDKATTEAIRRVTNEASVSKTLVVEEEPAMLADVSGKVGALEPFTKYDDKDSRPQLRRQLQRPLSHIWHKSEEHRAVEGKQRWAPAISEYQEPELPEEERKVPVAARFPPTSVAKKLLTTKLPQHATRDLTEAVERIHTAAKGPAAVMWQPGVDPAQGEDARIPESVVMARPTTSSRDTGRLALTMLAPSTVDPEGNVPKEDDLLADPDQKMEEEMALRVAVAPQRGRTMISFKSRIEHDQRAARLALFEHVKGSKVHNGLYNTYTLPNGKETFYYYHAGGMVDECAVDLPNPPLRPDTMASALQDGLPMGVDMEKVCKPPGPDGMWLALYKPTPPLCPLPSKHTLRVKDSDSLAVEAFADLDDTNIGFVVTATKTMKHDVQETRTKIIVARVRTPTPKPPWKLSQSIFRARLKECESKAFFDSQKVQNKHFEVEWALMTSKEKCVNMVIKENKNSPKKLNDKDLMKALKDTMHKHFPTICSVFTYYASQGSGSAFHMQLNGFTQFLDSSNIPDGDSQFCKRSDCDTTFIVANYEEKSNTDAEKKLAKLNDEHGLMKFELMEGLVRLAVAKYGRGQQTDDVVDALDMLFEHDINPNLPPMAMMDKNEFTRDRLYCEEVDDLYKKHEKMLRAIYSRYRLPPRSGGVRNKLLVMEDWEKLASDLGWVDQTFALSDVRLSFMHCRMLVADVVNGWDKYTQMTFIDFLEALGYVADNKFFPGAKELEEAGFDNWFEWQRHTEQGGEEAYNVITRRPSGTDGFGSAKNRPLWVKVEALLDMMFRRLYFDPQNVEAEFSYDGCINFMKKTDKNLGP